MGALPQLFMRQPDITNLPPLELPEGFTLHTHVEGQDKNWEDLIEKAFGNHFSFNDFIVNGGGYKPEYVLYIAKDGVDIATATAVEKDIFPGEGWFRMIGTAPEARGMGAGRLVCLAALHSLAERGYKSVVLSTDDPEFGGHGRISDKQIYTAYKQEDGRVGFYIYLPSRSAVVLKKKQVRNRTPKKK